MTTVTAPYPIAGLRMASIISVFWKWHVPPLGGAFLKTIKCSNKDVPEKLKTSSFESEQAWRATYPHQLEKVAL